MLRRIPILATAAAVLITAFGIAPANATVPDITGLTASPSTIYPLINNASRPGSSTITITGDASTVTTIEIRDASNAEVRDIDPAGQNEVTWDGRNDSAAVVPAGTYTVVAIGSGPVDSPHTTTITVSTKKLVLKTFTKTVTAASSLGGKFVGKCSTLRKPAKRKRVDRIARLLREHQVREADLERERRLDVPPGAPPVRGAVRRPSRQHLWRRSQARQPRP